MYPYKIRSRVPFPGIELLTRQKKIQMRLFGSEEVLFFIIVAVKKLNRIWPKIESCPEPNGMSK